MLRSISFLKTRTAALLPLLCFATSTFADIQTVTLNTGWDHANNVAYPAPGAPPTPDLYWRLVYDSTTNFNGGQPVPRASDRIVPHSAWRPAMPSSSWIAFNQYGQPSYNSGRARIYVFEKCFCLKSGFSDSTAVANSTMSIQLRADDWAVAYINQSLATIISQTYPGPVEPSAILETTSAGGFFSNPIPAQTVLNAADLTSRLNVGRNCVQVKLYDLHYVISGFNIAGSITAQGIEEISRFNSQNPAQQFTTCSSCYLPPPSDPDGVETSLKTSTTDQ